MEPPSLFVPEIGSALLAVNGAAQTAVRRTPWAMWGIALAVVLLLAVLAVLLRRERRRSLRAPCGLMLAWGIAAVCWSAPFLSDGVREWCELVSLVALALAAVRAAWLLVVDWGLNQGVGLGISQISRDIIQSAIYIVTAIAAARAAIAVTM